jgi:hypothetical protein
MEHLMGLGIFFLGLGVFFLSLGFFWFVDVYEKKK